MLKPDGLNLFTAYSIVTEIGASTLEINARMRMSNQTKNESTFSFSLAICSAIPHKPYTFNRISDHFISTG
jgi:hypothetical protein